MKPKNKFHKPIRDQFIYILQEGLTSQKNTFFLWTNLLLGPQGTNLPPEGEWQNIFL